MSELKLTLLGAPQIELNNQPIRLPRRKVMALFIYLAVTRQVHRREKLAALFWPEAKQQTARSALRRELATLRSIIGDEWFEVTRDEISLPANVNIWIDVVLFRRLAAACTEEHLTSEDPSVDCLQTLTAAATFYQDDFLSGFTLSDCPAFDDWQYFEAEALRRSCADCLQRLARIHAERGDYEAAILQTRRRLAMDPMHEPVHRRLMHLFAMAGQHAAAIRQYEECTRILDEELGVPPAKETVDLFESIRTRRYSAGASEEQQSALSSLPGELPDMGSNLQTQTISSALSPPSIPHVDWGEAPRIGLFYGRDAELAQLEQWLRIDQCRLVTILGMGGMGKASLAAKLTQRLTESGSTLSEAARSDTARSDAGQDGATQMPFQRVIWRSLLNAPPFADILQQWLQILSDQQVTDASTSLDRGLSLLLNHLRQARCLLVLDNVESILQDDGQRAGQYRAGYEAYGQLFVRLGESDHQSCLLLTSREIPHGIRRLQGDTDLVQSLPIAGLPLNVSRQFLADRGLADSESATAELVERYSGNPLALKLVTQTIQDLFAGDVGDFLADDALIFDDIRAVLDQQFSRLSLLEKELMIWLMLEREGIYARSLFALLAKPPTKRAFLEALRSLERRSLLLKRDDDQGALFTLQTVVTEYTTDHFIERICQELEQETLRDFSHHALLRAQAKEYVRESQARLVLQPIVVQLIGKWGQARLRIACAEC